MRKEVFSRLRSELASLARWLTPSHLHKELELLRLRARARREPTSTWLMGGSFRVPDGPSFYYTYRSVVEERIYEFAPGSTPPRIIDCGANIGLSVHFFASRYPGATIEAFEADPAIFAALESNVAPLRSAATIELIDAAAWDADVPELAFDSDGADAGAVADAGATRVRAVRLRSYLEQPVDMLKVDIEGSEVRVLADCADRLDRVKNLFVEYHSFCDRTQHLAQLIALLETAGFRLHIHAQKRSPHPLLERTLYRGMDLQLDIFGFR